MTFTDSAQVIIWVLSCQTRKETSLGQEYEVELLDNSEKRKDVENLALFAFGIRNVFRAKKSSTSFLRAIRSSVIFFLSPIQHARHVVVMLYRI